MNERYRLLKFLIVWPAMLAWGWSAYALVRGLAAIVYLDIPFYDWQWYVPLIFLLVGVPLYFLWSLSHRGKLRLSRRAVAIFFVLILWLVMGYNGFDQNIQLSVTNSAPIPLSFWAYSDFRQTPDAVLKDLQAARGSIYLDAGTRPFEDEGRTAFVAAMRRLADYNIPVYWAVPAPNFLSAPVAMQWTTNARRAAQLVRDEKLNAVHGFVGDIEQPLNETFDWNGSQRAEFEAAVEAYRQLQNDLQHEYPKLLLGVTAMWSHYFDPLDGDADLSIVLRSPLDPPGGWDFVNLMTYSSYYPAGWRPYYVYILEHALARLYPADRVSHLLGLVGGGMPGEPTMSFEELVRDARLSRALGVREIAVFQLDGALQVFGDDFVRRLNEVVNGDRSNEPVSVLFSRPVSILFYGIAVGDSLVDALYSRAWLFVLWSGVSGLLAWQIASPHTAAARNDALTPLP